MKQNELFSNTDDSTAERIGEEFPVLSTSEKERIFAMSERKFNINKTDNNNSENGIEVSGVEQYSSHKWQRRVYAAALALIASAGIFGGVIITKNLRSNAPDNIASQTDADNEETPDNTAYEAPDPRAEEYSAIALNLVEKYETFDRLLYNYEIDWTQVDDSYENSLVYYINETKPEDMEYIFNDTGATSLEDVNPKYLTQHWYSLYTGDKFSSVDDIKAMIYPYMTEECINYLYGTLIGDDLSGYASGTRFDYGEEHPVFGWFNTNGDEIRFDSTAMNHNEQKQFFYNRHDTAPEIADITDDSFTAYITYDMGILPMSDTMKLTVRNIDGNWLIDGVDCVEPTLDPEKNDIYQKMLNSTDYYDRVSGVQVSHWHNNNLYSSEEMESDIYNVVEFDYDNENFTEYYKNTRINTDNFEQALNGTEEIKYTENNDNVGITYIDDNTEYQIGTCDGQTEAFQSPNYYKNSEFYTDASIHEPRVTLERVGDTITARVYERGMFGLNSEDTVRAFELYNFNNWDITGSIEYCGRDCVVIEGANFREEIVNGDEADEYLKTHDNLDDFVFMTDGRNYQYKLYVDKATGVLLFTDTEDPISVNFMTTEIHFDDEQAFVRDFDTSVYTFNN